MGLLLWWFRFLQVLCELVHVATDCTSCHIACRVLVTHYANVLKLQWAFCEATRKVVNSMQLRQEQMMEHSCLYQAVCMW